MQDGPRKRCTGTQFKSLVFIYIPAREVLNIFHYMQVIVACGLHAFLSVQHKLSKSLDTYKQEKSYITWCKQQHTRLKNSLTFEQETYLHRTKMNLNIVYCKFCFCAFL